MAQVDPDSYCQPLDVNSTHIIPVPTQKADALQFSRLLGGFLDWFLPHDTGHNQLQERSNRQPKPTMQAAPNIEETEELKQFREAWKAEVWRKKQVGTSAGHGASLKVSEGAAPAHMPTTNHGIQDPIPRVSSVTITSPSEEVVVSPTRRFTAVAFASSGSSSPAVGIYRRAVLHEQKGELDEALVLYRQAFRRESNVDKLYHQEERLGAFLVAQAQKQKEISGSGSTSGKKKEQVDDVDEVKALSENLKDTLTFHDKTTQSAEKASKRASEGNIRSYSRLVSTLKEISEPLAFEPEDEKEPVPLNILPYEMVVHVLKHLDPSSIERFAAVNKKARVISLDSSIWRELVEFTYKPPQVLDQGVLKTLYDEYLYDHRRLYIEQPRVRMDGVYIAMCHYVRYGMSENSWVNLSHLITYHRYLRFYPNGQVLSLLTNEQTPAEVISRLKPTRPTKGLLIGTWHLSGTTIVLSNLIDSDSLSDPKLAPVDLNSPSSVLSAINNVHRTSNLTGTGTASTGPSYHPPGMSLRLRYVFTMSLSLRSRPLGRWNKLDITSYDSIHLETGDVHPVALKHERPFWFSKVRSYAYG
ncbi:hypothetical protein E1B28_007334 [Marasmius oreades]|uniref:F-box domain-containing protein n=1 Tax=Marasmius oreades TaxID=181124 RepID=A0A9P7S1N9_9AGAR|nr:uncharacterized protein E1B28_007334 [Marasmius oreades]KAG7093675.1 hypothetical protein E1B28_007334 [Marasmius oreades]